MKNIELGLMIEKHRPPYALSSLPFVLEDIAGRVKVCWFNYYLDQCDDMFTVFIPDIYTLDKNKKIYRDNTEIKIITRSNPYKKPKFIRKDIIQKSNTYFQGLTIVRWTI